MHCGESYSGSTPVLGTGSPSSILGSPTRLNFLIAIMEFDHTVTTERTFGEAVVRVQDEIAKASMRVLHIHDVQKTLGEKGFQREPFNIIEFCSAAYANTFLNADIRIGLCMPCKINVYVKDGQTFISGMRPIILPQFFPEADLGDAPQEIDRIIQNIINNAQ